MGIRALQNMATWSCLAVCLLLGAAPVEGLVLCVGPDGHVGVSSPDAGCDGCSEQLPPDGGTPRPGQSGIDPETPCCPCLDVPVMSRGEVVGPQTARPTPGHVISFPAGPPAPAMPAERPRSHALPGSPPPDASSVALAQLRSVVLRF